MLVELDFTTLLKPSEDVHLKSKLCTLMVLGLGVVCIVFGLSFGLNAGILFSKLYEDELALTPHSASHKLWVHTPMPLYLEVYLFNWTNAKEFLEDKYTIPHFEEVGPFVYSEVHDRINVVWNDNNTVTYNQRRKWNFIPELSEDLSVEVTNLNVIGTTLSQMLKDFSKFKGVINWLFKTENLAITAPAKKWIFEGIDDKLLEYVSVLEHIVKIPTLTTKFGWFYGRNMSTTYDGTFTVHTGTDNICKVGMMDKWNGMNQTDYFKGTCGKVNGTSGELFPPMNPANTRLNIFITDICSSLTLFYNETATVSGVEVYKYVGKTTTLDNGQYNPKEKCNCIERCTPYGVRDGSSCKKAPLYFSFPHFYLADPYYRRQVSGMMPNRSEHEFMILFDPVTGMPFDVKAQLQVNVRVEPISWLKPFSDFPEMYIPMMWFRQRAIITPELASKAYLVHILPQIIVGFCYGLLAFGFVIVIIRLFVILRKGRYDDDSELLIPPVMDGDENVSAK